MALHADLEVLQPIPYFPYVRPLPKWGRLSTHQAGKQVVNHAPMLYLPGVMKHWDGRFLERAVLKRIVTLGKQRPFDLIDAHFGYPDGVGAVRAAARLGLPAFVTIRGLETDYLRSPSIGPQLIEALKGAAGCISVSHALKALVVRHGVPGDHVKVIPNAVDRKVFFPGERSTARSRLGLRQDGQLIVSVGTMIDLKRHHVVVRALAELRSRSHDARLAIIGIERDEPGYLSRLRNLAEELNVADAVSFIGSVPPGDVANWLTAADVFCLASSREGCCNAILEALACGRPVVTTPVGDNVHYVIDGLNGYLVPVDDPDSTSRALSNALTPNRWDARNISGRLPLGDWEDVGRQVIDFFRGRLSRLGELPLRQTGASA